MATKEPKKQKLSITQIKAIVDKKKEDWLRLVSEIQDKQMDVFNKIEQEELAYILQRVTQYEQDPKWQRFIADAVTSKFKHMSDRVMYQDGIVRKEYFDASEGRSSLKRSVVQDKMCPDLKLALMLDPYADYETVAKTIEALHFEWKDTTNE